MLATLLIYTFSSIKPYSLSIFFINNCIIKIFKQSIVELSTKYQIIRSFFSSPSNLIYRFAASAELPIYYENLPESPDKFTVPFIYYVFCVFNLILWYVMYRLIAAIIAYVVSLLLVLLFWNYCTTTRFSPGEHLPSENLPGEFGAFPIPVQLEFAIYLIVFFFLWKVIEADFGVFTICTVFFWKFFTIWNAWFSGELGNSWVGYISMTAFTLLFIVVFEHWWHRCTLTLIKTARRCFNYWSRWIYFWVLVTAYFIVDLYIQVLLPEIIPELVKPTISFTGGSFQCVLPTLKYIYLYLAPLTFKWGCNLTTLYKCRSLIPYFTYCAIIWGTIVNCKLNIWVNILLWVLFEPLPLYKNDPTLAYYDGCCVFMVGLPVVMLVLYILANLVFRSSTWKEVFYAILKYLRCYMHFIILKWCILGNRSLMVIVFNFIEPALHRPLESYTCILFMSIGFIVWGTWKNTLAKEYFWAKIPIVKMEFSRETVDYSTSFSSPEDEDVFGLVALKKRIKVSMKHYLTILWHNKWIILLAPFHFLWDRWVELDEILANGLDYFQDTVEDIIEWLLRNWKTRSERTITFWFSTLNLFCVLINIFPTKFRSMLKQIISIMYQFIKYILDIWVHINFFNNLGIFVQSSDFVLYILEINLLLLICVLVFLTGLFWKTKIIFKYQERIFARQCILALIFYAFVSLAMLMLIKLLVLLKVINFKACTLFNGYIIIDNFSLLSKSLVFLGFFLISLISLIFIKNLNLRYKNSVEFPIFLGFSLFFITKTIIHYYFSINNLIISH